MLELDKTDLEMLSSFFSPEKSTQQTLKDCSLHVWQCLRYCIVFNSESRGMHCGSLDNGIKVYLDLQDNQDIDSYRKINGINFMEWLTKKE